MNEIDRLWEKYSSPNLVGKIAFRQAMTEALVKQRELIIKKLDSFPYGYDMHTAKNVILNTKLEEQDDK